MNIEIINRTYKCLMNISKQWFMLYGNIVIMQKDSVSIKNDLIYISQEIKNIYPTISGELFRLKDELFSNQGNINPVILGELISLLRFLKDANEINDLGIMIHPIIVQTSKKLFENGHYANAAEDAFIEINDRVKKLYMIISNEKSKVPDGVALIQKVFSPNKPMIEMADVTTETGKNIQQGYMEMLSGAILALRNPKAHKNIVLDKEECKKRLVFASMLMYKIDEGVRNSNIVEKTH